MYLLESECNKLNRNSNFLISKPLYTDPNIYYSFVNACTATLSSHCCPFKFRSHKDLRKRHEWSFLCWQNVFPHYLLKKTFARQTYEQFTTTHICTACKVVKSKCCYFHSQPWEDTRKMYLFMRRNLAICIYTK